jgi:pyruvate,water dikinase
MRRRVLGTVVAAGGSATVEVDAQLARRPSLSDAQVAAVAALAVRVEAHRGAPVDLEWAIRGDEVYLLQARPITAVSPPPDTRLPPP